MVDIKGGDFAMPPAPQQSLGLEASAIRNGSCSYCETMYKNLQYLESYLRSNTAKNSCNSCATCLSFLLYMKQQSVTQPRLDQYIAGEHGSPQSNKLPSDVNTDCYAMQQTVTYHPSKSPALGVAQSVTKKPRLKNSGSVAKTKSFLKPKLTEMTPSRLSKSQSGVTAKKHLTLDGKKARKLRNVDGKTSHKTTAGLSADAMPKPTSMMSKYSAGNRRKRAKMPSTKSSLSKDSTVKSTKQKKSRAPRKKVKISKV